MYRTRQELFDLAWAGLESQRFERSMDQLGNCLYRGPGGLRCAIGWLIEDDQVAVDNEGATPHNCYALCEAALIAPSDTTFAVDLQVCHDQADNPAQVRSRLIVFAADEGLTLPASALSQEVNIE